MNGADWIWCLEDDMLAPVEFLAVAKNWITRFAGNSKLGYLYPTVLSIHDRRTIDCAIFFSTPRKKIQQAYSISKAQFGGLLINSKAVKDVGLPIKEFFIFYDDWEYTSRMSKQGWEGYWLSSVFVWHNSRAKPQLIPYIYGRNEDMWKFYYGVRNELAFTRVNNPFSYIRQLAENVFIVPLKILLKRPGNKFPVAYNWCKWSLKSVLFRFKPEKITAG
jgi:GT2 family glycosyltransferase